MALRYNQGDLDGLCGMYSLINGVHHLMKTTGSKQKKEDMFPIVASALRPKDYPRVLWEGTSPSQLARMAQALVDHLEETYDGQARFQTRFPFRRKSFDSASQFYKALDAEFDPATDVVILWIEWSRNRGGHWTALKKIDASHVWIVDSSHMRKLRRTQLAISGTKSRIVPAHTLRIRMTEWEGEWL